MASPRPKLADVARAAGVSAMTVSNVLNGRPGVAQQTRERVLEAARQLGYTPNLQARGLAGGSTQLIGLISHDLSVQYAWELVRGVCDELADGGYEIIISATYQDVSRERERITFLTGGQVDGLLLIAPVLEREALAALASSKVPAVVLDPRRDLPEVPRVRVHNYEGTRQAAEALMAMGHRRIGFIGGDPTFTSSGERLRGYRDAVAIGSGDRDSSLIVEGGYSPAGGFTAAMRLLDLPQPPTAIMAAADLAAFGAMDAVKARGLKIPEDVSVVGFDDLPMAAETHPALTTVRQPLAEVGATGARMLLTLIRGERLLVEDVRLPTELVVRESAAPAAPGTAAAARS